MIFSIIITTYNYEQYIQQAVESALNQDYDKKYEVIVVDDCSTDNTAALLDQYHELIRITNSSNQSLETSVNKGIKKANGKYIIRLDADDYLEHDYLTKISRHIKDEEHFYFGNYSCINETGKHISTHKLMAYDAKEIQSRGDFLATATVYSKKMLIKVGLYNDSIKNCGLENYELILRLINAGFKGVHIKEPLFFYRRHGHNLSKNKLLEIIHYGHNLADQYQIKSYTINQYHPYLKRDDIIDYPIKYIPY